jgi:hypothetical protein
MLTFVEAAMGAKPTPLTSAFGTMLATRRPTGNPNMEVALAWHLEERPRDCLAQRRNRRVSIVYRL